MLNKRKLNTSLVNTQVSMNFDVLNKYGIIDSSGLATSCYGEHESLPNKLFVNQIIKKNKQLIQKNLQLLLMTPIGISLDDLTNKINTAYGTDIIHLNFNYQNYNEHNFKLTYYPQNIVSYNHSPGVYKIDIINQIEGIFEINLIDLIPQICTSNNFPNQILANQIKRNQYTFTIEDYIFLHLMNLEYNLNQNFNYPQLILSNYIPDQNFVFKIEKQGVELNIEAISSQKKITEDHLIQLKKVIY